MNKYRVWEENAKKGGKEEKIRKGLRGKRKGSEITVPTCRRRRNGMEQDYESKE
jgi:hypothetical protein